PQSSASSCDRLLKCGVLRRSAYCCTSQWQRCVRNPLPSAKKSPERFEQAVWERKRFLRPIRRLLCKRPLRPAVHLAGNSWYLVDRQIDVVSGAGCRAAGGGELI